MAKSTTPKPVEELTYEQALEELEQIVSFLESEQNALDQAMAFFERGQALILRCEALLEQAELKIVELSGDPRLDAEGGE